jgi:hypothetical protein
VSKAKEDEEDEDDDDDEEQGEFAYKVPAWEEADTKWKQPYLEEFRSPLFQWLPAEFRVEASGAVVIQSPINNLHANQHRELYDTIGAVFERSLPLLEHTLSYVAMNKSSIFDVEIKSLVSHTLRVVSRARTLTRVPCVAAATTGGPRRWSGPRT